VQFQHQNALTNILVFCPDPLEEITVLPDPLAGFRGGRDNRVQAGT